MTIHLTISTAHLATFCQRHHIRKLSLFGSALRDDFSPDSDVDVLVEFEPEARVGFFKFIQLEDALTVMLGRQVDLHTPQSLSRHVRQTVFDSAITVYPQ